MDRSHTGWDIAILALIGAGAYLVYKFYGAQLGALMRGTGDTSSGVMAQEASAPNADNTSPLQISIS